MKLTEIGAVGKITKQNATKDAPIGSEFANVKKLGLGSGEPKELHRKARKNSDPNTLSNLGIGESSVQEFRQTSKDLGQGLTMRTGTGTKQKGVITNKQGDRVATRMPTVVPGMTVTKNTQDSPLGKAGTTDAEYRAGGMTVRKTTDTKTGKQIGKDRVSYNIPGKGTRTNENTSSVDAKEIEALIRKSARARGMDPDTAVAVWRSEGGTQYQSRIKRKGKGSEGGYEASYGPFQLYTGGGLGNEYQQKYGVDLRKDNTPDGIKRQIDFSLDKAKETGWTPWYGAKRVGISKYQGIDTAKAGDKFGVTKRKVATVAPKSTASDDMSFGDAFKAARAKAGGAGGMFTYKGKQYQTNVKGEKYVTNPVSVDEALQERSLYSMLTQKMASKISPAKYEKAGAILHDVLVRKMQKTRGKLRHGLLYYAQQIARQFEGMDYRALADYYKDHWELEGITEDRDMTEGKRVPRKKGQPAGSKKHSDLYTDENPRGTIQGLKFATVADAKASVNKIKSSGKKHAHKIQAAIAMEQRAKAAGKKSAAAVYRKYINAMKKKTKKMNELRIEKPDPKDTLGVARKLMPQVKSEDYEEFIDFLQDNGARFERDTIPARELQAMQSEFSDKGIIKQLEKNIDQGPNTKAVIVSSDNYVLDGHHRWLVAMNTGTDLNVFRVNMPAWKLYDLVNQFEKVYYKDIYDETRGSIGVPLSSGLTVSIFPHRPLKIKKSTPGKLRYDEDITAQDLDQLETFADKMFAKVGIDVEFTRHFLDRVNDERNKKPITMAELTRLFKQEYKRYGKPIAQMGPDQEAVMKDLQTDINLPFVLQYDRENNELDLVAKTVMRKKDFKTPDREFAVEGSHFNNPKNTFLTKADTAYDFLRIGKHVSNIKSVKKGANRDEPDVMIVPYGGEKEAKYLQKQLKRIGYKTQNADKHGDDAHFDESGHDTKPSLAQQINFGGKYGDTKQPPPKKKYKPLPKQDQSVLGKVKSFFTSEELDEDLRDWFKQKWVNIGKKNKDGSHPECGTSGKKSGYAKCVPAAKAAKMTKKEKESAVRRKRAAQNKKGRGGKSKPGSGKKPIRVSTKAKRKKKSESIELCPRTRASICQCESVYNISESQDTVTAVCELMHSDTVKGTLLLKQQAEGPTIIVGKITGLEPGNHGFHVHEFGDMSEGCETMGAHYNPDGVDHGDIAQGHVGDLGNVVADDNGVASIEIVAERVDLRGERSIVGRGIVVHKDEDDLGKGGDAESLKTGNAGDRLACGVVLIKQNVNEGWSAKYKRSINCNNPKGFSQRAHCAGRKKKKRNETKEAPPGTYFTKSGNLVKGRLTKDAKERGARQTDPKDLQRSKVPPVTQYNESFVKPQFDREWDEAARYPEFVKIGKQAWIELASKGRAVEITDASDINNTEAADPSAFDTLDSAKQRRALAQLERGIVEMPIVAVYSDGYKELIAGNTRLTAMMGNRGRATVWQFEVPDEVANLAQEDVLKQLKGTDKFTKTAKPGGKESPHPARGMLVGNRIEEGVNDPNIFKAVFMAGGPGSGKGFVVKNILGGTGLRTVNSDDMFEYLMKKADLALDPDTIGSDVGQQTRGRAKELTDNRMYTYLKGRLGLIIDGTGKDVTKYAKQVEKLKALGYDCMMLFVNTSEEVAQQRNMQRERSIPPTMVRKMWNEVQQNLMKFQQIFGADRFYIIDNSGGLEDLDRKENFDKVYNNTQRFLNTPPSKRAATRWIQQQKAQTDGTQRQQQQTTSSDGGTENNN